MKQALDALQEHAKQPFFGHVLVTDDPQTLLQLHGASLAQVLSDLDRVQGIQKCCGGHGCNCTGAGCAIFVVDSLCHRVDANGTPNLLHFEKNTGRGLAAKIFCSKPR